MLITQNMVFYIMPKHPFKRSKRATIQDPIDYEPSSPSSKPTRAAGIKSKVSSVAHRAPHLRQNSSKKQISELQLCNSALQSIEKALNERGQIIDAINKKLTLEIEREEQKEATLRALCVANGKQTSATQTEQTVEPTVKHVASSMREQVQAIVDIPPVNIEEKATAGELWEILKQLHEENSEMETLAQQIFSDMDVYEKETKLDIKSVTKSSSQTAILKRLKPSPNVSSTPSVTTHKEPHKYADKSFQVTSFLKEIAGPISNIASLLEFDKNNHIGKTADYRTSQELVASISRKLKIIGIQMNATKNVAYASERYTLIHCLAQNTLVTTYQTPPMERCENIVSDLELLTETTSRLTKYDERDVTNNNEIGPTHTPLSSMRVK